MVVASIDLQNGKVVQLKQGAELVLQRDNAAELAEEFDRYGEVAVIDLDAAKGVGSNIEIIKTLLPKAECRIGGGIRTPEQAKELISLGAKKIIVGSVAFRLEGGGFGINIPLLEAFEKKIGRERLIVAIDARDAEITVDGWKTPTGIGLIEAARAVEKYSSDLLFTCVEREGTMTGIDMALVKSLREAVSCNLTAAGGVSTLDEIEELARLGCDVQLGMAIYTGKINLADTFIASLNWKKEQPPLLPIIAQAADGQVLMTGYTDREALSETFKRGNLCFHSRTRNKLWMKGETSGNTLKLLRLRADCDRDAILASVDPAGPVCHTGAWSCFSTGRRYTWELLQKIIADRFRNPVPGSYTATLDDKLVREKLMEEAEELCTAKTHDEIVWEAADLIYFATALITRSGVDVKEVLAELERRHMK
jgi:phosphoribosyl-ATP pyrophosphohydrolase/phosphoribosyl-AMP cyclohydrolase